MSPTILAAAASLLATVGTLGLLWIAVVPSRAERRRRELTSVVREQVLTSPRPAGAGDSSRSGLDRIESTTARFLADRGWDRPLAERLRAAGIQGPPARWVLYRGGIVAAAAVGLWVLTGAGPAAALLGAGLGVMAVFAELRLRAARRTGAAIGALPDTIQSLAAALQSGAALSHAFAQTAAHAPGPLGEELREAVARTRLGEPLPDALADVAARLGSEELAWVVLAIRLHTTKGGSLSPVLLTVAAALRERAELRREVRALSAEGRLSLIVMCGLPPVFLAVVALMRPEYFEFYTRPMGLVVLVGCAVWMSIGALWARRIVDVDL